MKYLVDASNIAYMCLFVSGLQDENWDNEELHGMFYHVFLSKLNVYLREINPTDIWLCWDSTSAKEWRKSIFPPYNEHRKKQKENRAIQVFFNKLLPNLKKVLENYPVNSVEYDRGEADDIIYCLCGIFKNEDLIKIISSDGDLKQLYLFYDNIYLWNPRYKRKEEKPTDNFIKLKAIIGDTSDNIPGIYRIGEKTAPAYLNGEKSFNEEQQIDYEKFLKIIDLSQYGHKDEMENYFRKYIETKRYQFLPDQIEWFLIEQRMNDHYYRWSAIKEDILKTYKEKI